MTKIGAKHYEYEELFTVAVDQQNRTCTVVGRDKEGRYILEQAGETISPTSAVWIINFFFCPRRK